MKTTAHHAFIALLIACLLLPFAVLAAESGVSQTEFQAYKKDVQVKLDETKDSLPAKVKERMDERVGDLAHHLTILSSVIGAFGVLLTVVGLVGWVSVKDRASNEVRDWIEEKGQEKLGELIKQKEKEFDADLKQRIDSKLKEFESQLENMKKAVAQKQKETLDNFDELVANAKTAIEMKQQQFSIPESNTVPLNPLPQNDKAISELAELLKHKPESEYTFDNWNTRAFDAVNAGQLDDAIYHWRASINVKDATKKQAAQSLYNTGVALGELNRSEEAIAVYDEVEQCFGEATEPALREWVAKALVNKGITLGQLNRCEEEIAMYDAMMKRFEEASEPALREQVATALVNKGVALEELNRSKEAIATYNEVLKRFGVASESALRGLVARAQNGKGFNLFCRAKANWQDEVTRNVDLKAALALFKQAEAENPSKAIVWGNQAYCHFLLSQTQPVRALLQQALQQGGEEFYQATLSDLAIHPVPPDADYRILLDEVWAEVQTVK